MKKINTSAYMPTEIEVENISANKVQISAYPFESGFAVTLAHPLRRLLLGSTIGSAPTAVKIEGVTHEFDSMRGMLEDVALFIINLKNIRFKIKGDEKRVEVNYSFSGPKEIKGSDLANSHIEIVTPDTYLATINEDAEFNFSLIIEKGIGYVPSENIRDLLTDDYIALDAFFTPVKRAVYDIENVLVEDNPNYEKIVFTIETDGLVSPIEAFKNALEAMYAQMSVFNGILDIAVAPKNETSHDNVELGKLLQSVEELNLSARSFNCLDRAEVKYIGELALMSETELKDLKNLGKKSLEEIRQVMEESGYPVGYNFSDETASLLKKKIEDLKSEANEG
ncbi:DNA-directed RNA polymerase subunit alpha [Sulfurospirillum deleyianum]|uniref:DNA-directed RNA polymerase subunit alpha n=1 Tax=Sulfurospirillum deleyianum (strain ATCC 51133 / DSM 6946 / 5175) TaxID=525898 RepID=D1B4D7_SULD5|nr:DNA-directed RNA polymerase subunit alpha [Sulfurospirillum deleyianum]ACZ12957.1 DNA-directed RNA polymerase, alpha subunit [Sulfurospirillum deleyianum DSM 6946]